MRLRVCKIIATSLLFILTISASNPRQQRQNGTVSDPTASKTSTQMKGILSNLASLSEKQLVAFGTSNPSACGYIKKDHLEKGNPFRYTLIKSACLGSTNLEHLSMLVKNKKSSIVEAISGNRQFWCPYVERTDISKWVKVKNRILSKAGCPGHQASVKNRNRQALTPETDTTGTARGLLIAGAVLLALIILAIIISIIVWCVRHRRNKMINSTVLAKQNESYYENPSAPTTDFSIPPPSYETLQINPLPQFSDHKNVEYGQEKNST